MSPRMLLKKHLDAEQIRYTLESSSTTPQPTPQSAATDSQPHPFEAALSCQATRSNGGIHLKIHVKNVWLGVLHPRIKKIKLMTFSKALLKVVNWQLFQMGHLLLTSSTNSKLDSPTPLLIVPTPESIWTFGLGLHIHLPARRRLQAMLCVRTLELSFRNSNPINTQKMKVRPSVKLSSFRMLWRIASTWLNPTPFPCARTLRHLRPWLLPICRGTTHKTLFQYLWGLILNPKLTDAPCYYWSNKTRHAVPVYDPGVSHYLRCDWDRNLFQRTLTQHIGLRKSTILPYFLRDLCFIKNTTDIQIKMIQTSLSLNLSLAQALQVYGYHNALFVRRCWYPVLQPNTIRPLRQTLV